MFSASNQPAAAAQTAPSASSQQQPASVQQQPSQAASASGNAPSTGQDSFLSPENREKALKELTDMGFERRQAELALRASFYHVERAAEYLITVTKKKFFSHLIYNELVSFRVKFPIFMKEPQQVKEVNQDKHPPVQKVQQVVNEQAEVKSRYWNIFHSNNHQLNSSRGFSCIESTSPISSIASIDSN